MTKHWRLIISNGKILTRANTAARLDQHQRRNRRTRTEKLHKHRLRVQAIQPGSPRPETDSAQSAEFLGHVSPKRAAETGRASFCRLGFARTWLRGFLFSLNIFCLIKMDAKLAKIYYSPQGYWKGVTAIKKLADTAKAPENIAK